MSKRLLACLIGLFMVASSVLALNGFVSHSSAVVIDDTPDDDRVAIIRKGAFTEAELRAKAAQGDVPKVFAAFGINQSELNGFVNGVVWRDGRVTVGTETVVATGAVTAGRWDNPKPGMTRIPGTDRAYKMSPSNFVTDGQVAFIKMVNGQFDFAIIKTCGNPVTAKPKPKPPTPTYACVSLRQTPISGSRTAFRFDAEARAAGGAKITKYTFDFGDNTTPFQLPTNGGMNAAVSHTYQRPGTYTARVTVTVLVNGQEVPASGSQCTARVTVTPPPTTQKPEYRCDKLTASPIQNQPRAYRYTLTYTAEGGATLREVDFNFGDDTSLNDVKPADLGNVTHTYTRDGTFTTVATLHFNVANGVREDTCQVTVKITPDMCPIPGKEHLPKDSRECVETPPQPLPSTGPAEMAMGGLGVGSIAGAGYYWRSSRRNLINKLLNR